jgi:membrane protease YdiL (CAAX protease family)
MTISELLLLVSEWLGVGSIAWIAGLSPRFHRRPINFIYQRRENIVSFSLFLLALIVAFVVKSSFYPTSSFDLLSLPRQVSLRLILAVVLVVPFMIALVYRRQPIRTFGWGNTLRPGLQLGFGLMILVIFLHGKIFSIINHLSSEMAVLFLAILVIALLEESVFRGYIFIRLTAGFGMIPGLIITALLSTVWRVAFFTNFSAPLGEILLAVVIILIQSLLLGWVMMKSGHVIAAGLYLTISDFVGYLP